MAETTTAGTNSPVAGINYASPLPALMQLIQYMGGTQQKSSESGSSSTAGTGVSATTGQTGPLEQIFAQAMDPNGLSNLVANLFAQGAQQVPGLTTQFANATGTRTDNNSMLAQSLALLHQNLAQSIAQAAVQQQSQVAVPAAQSIAKANTATTQQQAQTGTTQKSGTTTTQPGSLKNAAGTGLAIAGGGYLLNKFGDKILGKTGNTGADNAAPIPVTPAAVTNSDFNAFPVQDMGNDVAGGIGGGATFVPAATDLGSNVVDVNPISSTVSSEDLSAMPLADISPDVTDIADLPDDTFSNFTPDFSPDDFSSFFMADGGVVPGVAGSGRNPSVVVSGGGRRMMKPAHGYADGGEIDNMTVNPDGNGEITPAPRNLPNFGPRLLPQSTGALNVDGSVLPGIIQLLSPEPQRTPAITVNPLKAGVGRSRNTLNAAGTVDTGETDGGADTSSEAGNPGGAAVGASAGSIGLGSGALGAGLAAASGFGLAGAMAAGLSGMAKGAIANAIANALAGTPDASPTAAMDVASALGQTGDIAPGGVNSGMMGAVADAGVTGTATGTDEGSGYAGDVASGFGATGGTTGFGGDATSGDAAAGDAGSGDAGYGGGGDAGAGGDGGGGDGGGGGGEADGGILKAKNQKDFGIDNMQINAMPGEYVLPVDVVDMIGVDQLDELVQSMHIPIKRGTRGR